METNWRAQLRAEGIGRRRLSNHNDPDRGYVEQPGEGAADKPPPSSPRLPPHSRKPSEPTIIRRIVTPLTPRPEKPKSALDELLTEYRAEQPPLPPPSVSPAEQQTLVLLPREPRAEPRQACGKRARRCWKFPDEFKDKVLARHRELGPGSAKQVAREFDIAHSMLHRWLSREGSDMKKKKNKKKTQGTHSEETKREAIRRVLAAGNERGAQKRVERELGLSKGIVSYWLRTHARNGQKPASSRSADKALTKSAPASTPFLQGLEEFVEQIVERRLDERVEQKLKELLRNKSLMELMR